MPPVSRIYKTGSIIYFEGDKSETVFVLQTGVVQLTYRAPDGPGEVRETIKSGEFFGVKSALGRFPREETATVLADSSTMCMSIQEFEQLVLGNHKLVMKMLKIFSNQLRRIGKIVQMRMETGVSVPDGSGLFNIGEYYLENKKFNQAIYAYQKYIEHYPQGEYVSSCEERIGMAEKGVVPKYSLLRKPPPVAKAEPVPEPSEPEVHAPAADEIVDPESSVGLAKRYFAAFGLLTSGKVPEAYEAYKAILDKSARLGGEYIEKSFFDVGRCLVSMNKAQEAVAHLNRFIEKFPNSQMLKQALFVAGKCYVSLGDREKAKAAFTKVQNTPPNEAINKKAQMALAELGGGK